MMKEKVLEIARETIETLGFTAVELRIGSGKGIKKLYAVLFHPDRDVGMEDCARVSNVLLRRMEIDYPEFSENYDLTVESPGVDRKLANPEEAWIFKTKKIRFVLKNPKDFGLKDNVVNGFLDSFEGKRITVKTDNGMLAFNWDDLSSARLYFDIKDYL